MSEPLGYARSAQLASRFEAAQLEFSRLIESLTDEQWRRQGRNYPQRRNDEDETRTVGVIAHHVAVTGDWIMNRIQTMLSGQRLTPADIREMNAEHAARHSTVTKAEVLTVLHDETSRLAQMIRDIPDAELDIQRDTPVGRATVAERIEGTLIGHITEHDGSIRAAI